MKDFEYAAPREEADVVGLLAPEWAGSEVLAGGTDLIGLMRKMIVTPERVVNIMEVASFRGIERDSTGVSIGAVTTLDDVLASPDLDDYPAIKQAIQGIASPQLQSQGTIGGELCQRPRCWYFRDGHGLLAARGRKVTQGDNRYHAIFGNAGPAKFVSASRIAPALVALGARLRIVGPAPTDEALLPVEFFYRTPRDENQRENVLLPNQVVTHIHLPPADGPGHGPPGDDRAGAGGPHAVAVGRGRECPAGPGGQSGQRPRGGRGRGGCRHAPVGQRLQGATGAGGRATRDPAGRRPANGRLLTCSEFRNQLRN
jgi:xanthine dehydrogenase YagS FAD-binding subunit